MLDLTLRCSDCGLPFEFFGVPVGVSQETPMMSFNKQELRIPVRPTFDPVDQVNAMLGQ